MAMALIIHRKDAKYAKKDAIKKSRNLEIEEFRDCEFNDLYKLCALCVFAVNPTTFFVECQNIG
jgi:hypothetical protein